MSRFPTDRHAASWTAICPSNHESAGKRKSGRPRNGNPHLRAALVESANAAIRTKDTYLRAQYEQVKRRRGHKRAIGWAARRAAGGGVLDPVVVLDRGLVRCRS